MVGNRARTLERRNTHRVLGDQVTMKMPVKEAMVEPVRWKAQTDL